MNESSSLPVLFFAIVKATVLARVTWICLNYIKKWRRKCCLLESLPCVKPTSPLLYHLADIWNTPRVPGLNRELRNYWSNTTKMAKIHHDQYGYFAFTLFSPYYLPFLSQSTVVVTDLELVQQVVTHPQLQSKGKAYDIYSVFTKDSVLVATGHDWKRMRKLTSKAFSNNVMNNTNFTVHDIMVSKINPLLYEHIEQQKEVDVKDLMSRLALDVVGVVAFSYNVGGLDLLSKNNSCNDNCTEDKKELYRAFSEISEQLTKVFWLEESKLLSRIVKMLLPNFNANVRLLNDTVTSVLEKRRLEPIAEEDNKNDLLSYLIENDENGNPILMKEELVGNIRTFLFAGSDTTSTVLTCTLYELSRKPMVVQKLRTEIDPLFPKADAGVKTKPTYAQLQKCRFLNGVINEVLRLHAPALFSRSAPKGSSAEIKLETSKHQFVIPADTNVIIAPWLTHRLDTTKDDTLFFDPDRVVEKTDPFFPFAIGSRNCVGRELALAEIRAVIACIVYEYDFEAPSEDVVTYVLATLQLNQCKMKFKRRCVELK